MQKKKIQQELVEIEKQLILLYQRSQKEEEEATVRAIRSYWKYFYTYAKKYSSIKTNIGPLMNNYGQLINDNVEMANILAEQYLFSFQQTVITIHS